MQEEMNPNIKSNANVINGAHAESAKTSSTRIKKKSPQMKNDDSKSDRKAEVAVNFAIRQHVAMKVESLKYRPELAAQVPDAQAYKDELRDTTVLDIVCPEPRVQDRKFWKFKSDRLLEPLAKGRAPRADRPTPQIASPFEFGGLQYELQILHGFVQSVGWWWHRHLGGVFAWPSLTSLLHALSFRFLSHTSRPGYSRKCQCGPSMPSSCKRNWSTILYRAIMSVCGFVSPRYAAWLPSVSYCYPPSVAPRAIIIMPSLLQPALMVCQAQTCWNEASSEHTLQHCQYWSEEEPRLISSADMKKVRLN